jgi:hypothetical protein
MMASVENDGMSEYDDYEIDIDHEVINQSYSRDSRRVDWQVIKVLRNDYVNGKASAVQIRQGETENGNLSFSYSFGVYILDGDDERWVHYNYLPDRFVADYIRLLNEAVGRIRDAMREAREEGDGRIAPDVLLDAVKRNVLRRR